MKDHSGQPIRVQFFHVQFKCRTMREGSSGSGMETAWFGLSWISMSANLRTKLKIRSVRQILLLPWKALCLNAHGFVGRGLCLTQTGETRIDVSHTDSRVPVQARPTLYNCAFTMGTETSFSRKEFADCPIHQALEIDSGTFLISSDVASWPRLQIARSGKFITAPEPNHHAIVSLGVFLGAVGACMGLVLIMYGPGPVLGILMLVLAAPIGFLLSILTHFCVNSAQDALSRKQEYVRWVKSFAITGLD